MKSLLGTLNTPGSMENPVKGGSITRRLALGTSERRFVWSDQRSEVYRWTEDLNAAFQLQYQASQKGMALVRSL